MADFINDELEGVKIGYKKIDGTELVSCVPALVQFRMMRTKHKSLVINYHFPEGYPNEPLATELKSRYLSDRLLEGLVKVADEEAKKMLGEKQVLQMTRFFRRFIDDNPLCVCSDEIADIKRNMIGPTDEIKLKQKTSQVVLKMNEGSYFMTTNLLIPDEYPLKQLGFEIASHNFPDALLINISSQSVEIARRCVQPPLKPKPKAPPFEPKPSLGKVAKYLIEIMRDFPNELCPVCNEPALPIDAKDVERNPKGEKHIERMYCNHLYHQGCVNSYMKQPPFTGGKKCLKCGHRLFHEKWKVAPEIQEARWAHKEARRRELEEVVDFLE